MRKFILKRLLNILLTLFVIATFTFFLMKLLPGSPFDEERLSALSTEQRAEFLSKYGLDKPVANQYLIYLKNVVQGDLGTSYYYKGHEVSSIIGERIGPSALLGFQAVLLGLTIGLLLRIIAAYRHISG